MSKAGIDWNDAAFRANFTQLTGVDMPEWIVKGLFNAMNEILADSINLPPQAPKDMGDLWGSRSGADPGNPIVLKKTSNEISVEGGFNIAYARKHHEVPPGTFKYTKTKGAELPGPKFMESKMSRFKDKYAGIVAETIRRKGG